MPAVHLVDRGVVRLAGEDARSFLDGLVTSAVEHVAPGTARWAALLSPQGKILFDFLVFDAGDGLFLDVGRGLAVDLVRRLTLYRLRAKVTIEEASASWAVAAAWDGTPLPGATCEADDPREPGLGRRAILPAERAAALDTDASAWQARRIALGIPEGGRDFAYGDAFPHEVDMDQLAGVDFGKGCFIGQEVVSRMQHRGSVRTRVVPVRFETGVSPPEGTEATAGGKPAGRIGSSAPGGLALAMLRLDRVDEALAAGGPVEAGGMGFTVLRPAWATFPIPGDTAKAGA